MKRRQVLQLLFFLYHADEHGGILCGGTCVAVIKEDKHLFSFGGDEGNGCDKLFKLCGAVKVVVSDRGGDIKPSGVPSMKSKIANR